ncbi:MAG: hypothetical protein EPO22_10440 [Dehalococcoidia bacterium]|nr:MAG: hypothetical protein EPO22_10440 [Dehalococcoidia bacterium]
MQARQIGRPNPASQARLQLLLLVLAAWDFLAFALELTNTRLLEIDGIHGALGARSVGGATLVLAIAYLYAARNPVRYRFVLWLAAVEQIVAVFAYGFHWARSDVGFNQVALPIVAAGVFIALLIATLPRQTDTL